MTPAPLLLVVLGLIGAGSDAPDAAPKARVDAGAPVAAPATHDGAAHLDAGAAHVDAGAAHVDAGAAHVDAGAIEAGAPHADTAVPHADTGAAHVDAGAAHVDGGPMGAGDAGVVVEKPVDTAVFAIVHERPSPLAFRATVGGKTARARANDAGTAMGAALDAEPIAGAPAASVRVQGEVAVVEVHGRSVATLVAGDADADVIPGSSHSSSPSSLERYAAEVDTRLASFIQEEERRSSLQALALRLFFSVLVCVLGLVTLRASRRAFTTWETRIEERGPMAPLRIFGQPLLSSDALRGILAVVVVGARLLAYVGVAAVVVGAVLGQFEATRPLLARLGGWALSPLLSFIDGVVTHVPGLVLAAVLLIGVRAGLRFVQLLLDGVAEGRVPSRVVVPGRVFPVRIVVSVAVGVFAAPLIVGAAFGRFGTPLETLALAAGGCTLLATVPVLASAVVGVVVLWRGTVKPGDWVEVGSVKGEVASIHLIDVVLVPEVGGTIHVPHLAFVISPVRQARAPRAELDVLVKRDRAMDKIDAALAAAAVAAAKKAGGEGGVELVDVTGATIAARLHIDSPKAGAREALVRAVVDATERGDLALHDDHRPGARA